MAYISSEDVSITQVTDNMYFKEQKFELCMYF